MWIKELHCTAALRGVRVFIGKGEAIVAAGLLVRHLDVELEQSTMGKLIKSLLVFVFIHFDTQLSSTYKVHA